tara:strand:- start:1674 stop:1853 length:180 start_codon:yes stop_codon:yes gene_type:complete
MHATVIDASVFFDREVRVADCDLGLIRSIDSSSGSCPKGKVGEPKVLYVKDVDEEEYDV